MYGSIYSIHTVRVLFRDRVAENRRRKKGEPSIDFAQTMGKYLLRWWLFIDLSIRVYAVVISDDIKKYTHTHTYDDEWWKNWYETSLRFFLIGSLLNGALSQNLDKKQISTRL